MPESRLEVLIDIAVQGLEKLKETAGATKEIGVEAESSGKSMRGTLLKGAAMAGVAGIAAQKGFDWLKGAGEDTVQLAKDTAGLTRQTGLETQAASAWVSMAKGRGIEVGKLNVAFTAFAKQQQAAAKGSGDAADAFAKVGISSEQLASGSVSSEQALAKVADQFQAMPDGAEKTAMATRLFGRAGLALLPILNQGSGELAAQQDRMKELGLTMDQDGQKKALELAKSQRELGETMRGVKMTIGQAVLPALVTLAKITAAVVNPIAKLVRESGALRKVLPIAALALIAIAVAAKAVAVGMAIAAIHVAFLWAALGVGVIVAVIAAFVLLYQKVTVFRNVVNAVWSWIKSNWPLLLGILTGPIGAAVILIIKNFDTVKSFVVGVWNAIRNAASTAASAVAGAFRSAASAITSAFGAVISFFSSLPGKIAGFFTSLPGQMLNIGKAIIEGLINGVKSAGAAVGEAIKSVIPGPLRGAVEKILPFQAGGVVPVGGRLALVGEGGPELLALPGGARVIPLQAGTGQPGPVPVMPSEIHVHLEVEGRELAQAVARVTAENQARR